MAPSTLNKFLTGETDHTLSLSTLGKLADALNLPPEDFFIILWGGDEVSADAQRFVSLYEKLDGPAREQIAGLVTLLSRQK